MNFLNVLNDLNEFKDTLETFYYDIKEIKPNNEPQEKDIYKKTYKKEKL